MDPPVLGTGSGIWIRPGYNLCMADTYFEGLNEDLLALLPQSAGRVLDVGCGTGRLGEAIKAGAPGTVVHGLDRAAVPLAEAAARLDRVFEADLDVGLPELAGPYDAILCGDVLEHLADPWTRLEDLTALLAPGGCVVASLPNVRHYAVVRDLLFRGRFRYRDKGILDRTHLRFFTLDSMRDLLAQAGLEIVEMKPRLGGNNLFWRGMDLIFGGRDHGLRAVQYAFRCVRR